MKKKAINPSYYQKGKYQCFPVMLAVFGKKAVRHFCICNAFKYIWRHKEKGGLEDIEKAIWYLKKYCRLSGKKGERIMKNTQWI